ncbi:helix-turn-helix domain-containing protein [Roseospira marina]
MDVKEVAERLKVHPKTVRDMIRRGEIPVLSTPLKAYRIDRATFEELYEQWAAPASRSQNTGSSEISAAPTTSHGPRTVARDGFQVARRTAQKRTGS